ncbi:hypothetical protein DPMN_058637 [Dreissena polymorpha]|uniref:Glycylpeptide N-tetradecanoyltransferase n=1 Tax=Dreissena polymorpha TaxID=45954 RepID=A0A9D4C2F0_DREPO|nr:hypothetical protein DPMN_058637 [Dreissena polymorpha]
MLGMKFENPLNTCVIFQLQNNGVITDFVSFYSLPSTVMHHPVHKTLRAAYSFYNVSTVTPWVDLMQDALIMAKNVSTYDQHHEKRVLCNILSAKVENYTARYKITLGFVVYLLDRVYAQTGLDLYWLHVA